MAVGFAFEEEQPVVQAVVTQHKIMLACNSEKMRVLISLLLAPCFFGGLKLFEVNFRHFASIFSSFVSYYCSFSFSLIFLHLPFIS